MLNSIALFPGSTSGFLHAVQYNSGMSVGMRLVTKQIIQANVVHSSVRT